MTAEEEDAFDWKIAREMLESLLGLHAEAWALIFGLLASTAFTLIVIPVVYYLIYRGKHEVV